MNMLAPLRKPKPKPVLAPELEAEIERALINIELSDDEDIPSEPLPPQKSMAEVEADFIQERIGYHQQNIDALKATMDECRRRIDDHSEAIRVLRGENPKPKGRAGK